jgi:hypothetical protein
VAPFPPAFIGCLPNMAGGATSSDRQVLIRRETVQIARGGQAGPGGRGLYTYFGETPWLNNAGGVAFRA